MQFLFLERCKSNFAKVSRKFQTLLWEMCITFFKLGQKVKTCVGGEKASHYSGPITTKKVANNIKLASDSYAMDAFLVFHPAMRMSLEGGW